MPRRNKKPQAKQNNGSANNNNSGKRLALDLGGQLGKGLIAGLVPIVVGAVAKGLSKIVPSPQIQGGNPVSLPSAIGSVVKSGKPQTKSQANGNMTIKHREYIADINVEETGFDLQFQFGINPGNNALFPWLSTVAQRFEMYKFRSLRVIYEPQTSSTSVGTLMLAIDYDAKDAPPQDKTQMMSYKNSVRSPLWYSCTHQSAAADLHRLKTNYILAGASPPDTDIKTYDIGNLYVAIQSNGSSVAAGELYVEYDVDLITPQINNIVPCASIFSSQPFLEQNPPTGTPPVGFISTYTPLGEKPEIIGSLPCQVVTNKDAQTQFLWIQTAGYYLLSIFSQNVFAYDNLFITSNNLVKILAVKNMESSGSIEAYDYSQMSVIVIQIIDTTEPQLELGDLGQTNFAYNGTDSSIPPSKEFILISQYGLDGLPDPTFSFGLPEVVNPRARLGRRLRS
jgi:hypothetical protein